MNENKHPKTGKTGEECIFCKNDHPETGQAGEECIFCKIASSQVPSIRIYEDDDFIAFMDIQPITEGHCLLIPRKHYSNTLQMPDYLLAKALPTAKKIAEAITIGLGTDSFNLIQNNGESSGQTVFHWHLNIIPRKNLDEIPSYPSKPADITQLPFIASIIRENIDL